MSERLDPRIVFDLIAHHVPKDLHKHVLVAGSLAAAYHHRDRLVDGAVNTKDADVVVQPAGALEECTTIATRLLDDGWLRTEACYPRATAKPKDPAAAADWLRAIRLRPHRTNSFFIELLAFPQTSQKQSLFWRPCRLADGWYGLPCFRFLGLTTFGQQTSSSGLRYAAAPMMALANLLSHPTLERDVFISKPEGGRPIMRSAKDLGRVLALAWLTKPSELATWPALWREALRKRFPKEHTGLARRAGDGLRMLLADPDALDQARHSVDVGLLSGHGIAAGNLAAVGAQVIGLLLDPLARA
jgi:hypothetical protein